MSTLNLVPDCLADIVVIALVVCIYFDKSGYIDFQKNRLFQKCIYSSLIDVNLHIVGLLCVSNQALLPAPLVTATLTASFLMGGIVAFLVYRYLVLKLHSNSPALRCKRSMALRYGLSAVYFLAVLINLKTGWIFPWDSAGNFAEGKLYQIALILYIAHFLIMLGEFLIFKSSAHFSLYRLALIGIPVCGGATIVQLLFPDVSLNSVYGALAVFIIFISVQQSANEIDSLTSTFTRPMLNAFLELSLRRKSHLYILAVKMEQFQQINMRFGPENGDDFLKKTTDYLRQIQPKHVYRMKGATFALIFPNWTEDAYQEKLSEIRNRFSYTWKIHNHTETVIPAIFADLAWTVDGNKNANTILANLEYALSIAKSGQKRNYIRFDSAMQEAYDRREHVMNRIKSALDEEQAFRFCFQPIFTVLKDTEERKWDAAGQFPFVCAGAEALLRLNDADGTPLSPGEFIPIAENTGQIHEITHLTLRMACEFLSRRHLPDDWFLALNVSAHQFIDKNFIQAVICALETHKLNPRQIKLEITEYTSLVNEDAAFENIARLHQHGVEVFLDDFGTGYSNLFAASHLPIECVKIDRTLLADIQASSPAHGLLAAFINGFKKFGIPTLAEGIEEECNSR